PAVGSHRAVTLLAKHAGRFPGGQIADEQAFLDQKRSLGGYPLIVPAEGAQPGRRQGVGRNRDFRRAVLEMPELFWGHETGARVGRLHAKNTVQFSRMPAGLVNLKRDLTGIQDERLDATRTLVCREQGDSFLPNSLSVPVELQRGDVLIAGRTLMPAERIRIGPILDLVRRRRRRLDPGAAFKELLLRQGALGGGKDFLLPDELHRALPDGDA